MVAVAVLALGATEAGAASVVLPIPSGPVLIAAYEGAPATAQPITGIPDVPQNPFLAPNGNSGIHDDGWQTNTYTRSGPLGRNLQRRSALLPGECGSITFDSHGRIVATCISVAAGLYLIDPVTLARIATYTLPKAPGGIVQKPNIFQSFGGGGYFYLDNHDRAVVGTSTSHILIIAENASGTGFVKQRDYNLTTVLTSGETLNSVLPDSNGLLWFVAKTDGVVGTLNAVTGAIHVMRLGNGSIGEIENSFAVGNEGDVYIATSRALYRFDAGTGGIPQITWQATYPNSGLHKPGQVDDGTGTTPAVLPGGFVAITDNADPMDVAVYRTAPSVTGPRQVCAVPVFTKGASATENSLIAAGRSLVVENNYGYQTPATTSLGGVTKPGFARVDISPDGNSCSLVWTNSTLIAPTVVPKLSLANGLIYAYTKTTSPTDPWLWTAIDFRSGALVWRQVSGAGPFYNNNYAGLTLGPNGTAYLGVLGGIVSLRDGP